MGFLDIAIAQTERRIAEKKHDRNLAVISQGAHQTTQVGEYTPVTDEPSRLVVGTEYQICQRNADHVGGYMPDPIEFTLSPKYLNLSDGLYPRQATFLKIAFLRDDLFTEYDKRVIEEWKTSFETTQEIGISPDIEERIRICKAEGRSWFREIMAALGRRGSKGYLGSLCGAYILWHYLTLPMSPQKFYGTNINQRLTAMVFATKKEQAKANQFRALYMVIKDAPCFSQYMGQQLGESVSLMSYADKNWRIEEMEEASGKGSLDLASFEILPKESTPTGARGYASFMLMFDEGAHMISSTGGSREMAEVYDQAVPSLAQFRPDEFIYCPSSTWQKAGRYYELCQRAVAQEDGKPTEPDKMLLQLPSWDIYNDWEKASVINLYPPANVPPWLGETAFAGNVFPQRPRPMYAYDEQAVREEKANPEMYRVEYRSHWAAILDAYLSEVRIKAMFEPWNGREFTMQERGILALNYIAHGDPAQVNNNFGFCIGHSEIGPDGMPHVIFDVVHAWRPGDFEYNNWEIDYLKVEEDLQDYIERFQPGQLSFDQFNNVAIRQSLQEFVHENASRFPKNVQIFQRTATKPWNWKVAETFKAALNLGLIHSPYYELLEWECTYLQDLGNERVDHPDSGPVQTKDVFDACAHVVYGLIGEQMTAIIGGTLGSIPVHGAMGGGATPFPNAFADVDQGEKSPGQSLSSFGNVAARRSAARSGMRPDPVTGKPRGVPPIARVRRGRPGRGRY